MKSKLGIALSWVFVFLLGAVAGAVGYNLYQKQLKPVTAATATPKPGTILDWMANELQLDAQQKQSLKSIFDQSRLRYRELGQRYRPRWEAIRKETDEQIKHILRPEQRAKFEEFLKKAYAPPQGKRPPQSTSNKS
jgi:Spy/CpxP family protein refolding chaperone